MSVDRTGGKHAELYTLLKPGPVHHPWEVFTPTPPHEECGAACRTGIQEPVPAAAAIGPALAETELAACTGVASARRTMSPFANRDAIDEVQPITDERQLIGARVIFKPSRDLDVEAMRRHIACRRAVYAEVGDVAAAQTGDPTLVPDSDVDVVSRGKHVEVIVTTRNPDEAQRVLARARSEQAAPARTARR